MVDYELFRNVTDKLQIILDSRLESKELEHFIEDFKGSFKALLKAMPKFGPIKFDEDAVTEEEEAVFHANEDLIHSSMNFIVLQVKSLSKFATEVNVGFGRADVALVDTKNQCAAIIELKYEESAEIALQQINDRHYAKDIIGKYKTLLLGVNVLQNKTVEIKYEIS